MECLAFVAVAIVFVGLMALLGREDPPGPQLQMVPVHEGQV